MTKLEQDKPKKTTVNVWDYTKKDIDFIKTMTGETSLNLIDRLVNKEKERYASEEMTPEQRDLYDSDEFPPLKSFLMPFPDDINPDLSPDYTDRYMKYLDPEKGKFVYDEDMVRIHVGLKKTWSTILDNCYGKRLYLIGPKAYHKGHYVQVHEDWFSFEQFCLDVLPTKDPDALEERLVNIFLPQEYSAVTYEWLSRNEAQNRHRNMPGYDKHRTFPEYLFYTGRIPIEQLIYYFFRNLDVDETEDSFYRLPGYILLRDRARDWLDQSLKSDRKETLKLVEGWIKYSSLWVKYLLKKKKTPPRRYWWKIEYTNDQGQPLRKPRRTKINYVMMNRIFREHFDSPCGLIRYNELEIQSRKRDFLGRDEIAKVLGQYPRITKFLTF